MLYVRDERAILYLVQIISPPYLNSFNYALHNLFAADVKHFQERIT